MIHGEHGPLGGIAMASESTWEEEGVYLRFSGPVTADEIIRENLKMFMDLRFRGSRYQIWDFLNIDSFSMSEEEASMLSRDDSEIAGLAPDLKVAIVTQRDDIERIAELYQEGMEGSTWQARVFRQLDDARQWVLPK